MNVSREEIYHLINAERMRQDGATWGGFNHDQQHTINDWAAYVNHQLSQASRAAEGVDDDGQPAQVRHHLIQAAALIVAALESWQTRTWPQR